MVGSGKKFGSGAHVESGLSRLETLPDGVIEKLRRREFAAGEIIASHYRLKSLLGVGAMGQVFVAENLATGVEVAVKLLKPEMIASQEFRQRFQKEAEAVGSIAHQNVARFFDLVVGDPTFLVMEYVPGPTLQQVIEHEQRIAYERAIRIGVRLCWGLEAAHSRGIVHRDLKPANIIVAADAEVGEQPKIIDFGLAKLAAGDTAGKLTRTGQIVGTPEYMAPEQIEGKAIDARADVYALGCVLYKMIAGRSPFVGDDDVQVMYRQLHTKAAPLREVVPDVPSRLDDVLARALAKQPADRYAGTRELADALDRALERPRSSVRLTTDPIAAPARNVPVWLIAATTLAVGAVGGVIIGRAKTPAPANVAAPAAQPTPRELLVIATTPEGARIEVDGKPIPDKTPAALHGLAPGRHAIRVTAAGRAAVDRVVTIAPGSSTALVINMPPPQRNVLVRSIPSGAMVYLDGHPIGPAPATVVANEDDFHELRLEKLGFARLIRAITPDDREAELDLSMELDPEAHSELAVDSSAEAEIWIDGVFTGLETPAMGLRVTPGRHTIQLRDSTGASSKLATIDIKPGETQRLVLNP
jgi:predicted Ser/Thr protein kinase